MLMTLDANAADLQCRTYNDQADDPATEIEKAACIIMYVAICRRFPPGLEREHWHSWLARLQATPQLHVSALLPSRK
jgi:hypothetical protein